MIVANDVSFCDAILALLLEFHPGHRAEISHIIMNWRQPVTGSREEALRRTPGVGPCRFQSFYCN